MVKHLARQHDSDGIHETKFCFSENGTSSIFHSVFRDHQSPINSRLLNSSSIIQPTEDWLDELVFCNDDASGSDRHVILELMDQLFPNSKRGSEIKIMMILAVDEQTWIQTSQEEYS